MSEGELGADAFVAAARRSRALRVTLVAGCGMAYAGSTWGCPDFPAVQACAVGLQQWGALDGGAVLAGQEWWRVLASGLLHGGALHLGVNLWSLWGLAPWVVLGVGPVRAGVWLALGVVTGSAATLGWGVPGLVVGISGGLFAWAGLLLGLRARGRLTDLPTRGLAFGVGAMLLAGIWIPVIAQAAHVGGLVLGLVAGLGGTAAGMATTLAAVTVAMLVGPSRNEWGLEVHRVRGGERPNRLLELAPERDPLEVNDVAYRLAEGGIQLDAAQALAEVALAARGSDANVLDTAGWLHCLQGRSGEGLALLRRASTLPGGDHPEIVEHLSRCEGASLIEPRSTWNNGPAR